LHSQKLQIKEECIYFEGEEKGLKGDLQHIAAGPAQYFDFPLFCATRRTRRTFLNGKVPKNRTNF
jgi:hypothetical protein